MTHDVFISYSSIDKAIADAICASLEHAGIRCWIAPRDILPGDDWPSSISKAIALSRAMVLVFSASSNSSDDVGRELILAANCRLVIIPFKIENVEPEPGKQYYLARTHWLDAVNPPTRAQIMQLVETVKNIVARPLTATETAKVVEQAQPVIQVPAPSPAVVEKPVDQQPAAAPRVERVAPRKKTRWTYLLIPAALIVVAGICFGLSRLRGPGGTVSATATPVSPTATVIIQPTATPLVFSTSFNNPNFIGSFDPGLWTFDGDNPGVSIGQMDGAMVFIKPTAAGMHFGHLATLRTWALGDYTYIQARLKLSSAHTGDMGNVGFGLGDVACAVQIQGLDTKPFIWCAQSHVDDSGQWISDYMSSSYFIEYDQWYTTRIEFDPQTDTFSCFVEGNPFFSWQPADITPLLTKQNPVGLSIWVQDGTTMTAYVDDLSVGK